MRSRTRIPTAFAADEEVAAVLLDELLVDPGEDLVRREALARQSPDDRDCDRHGGDDGTNGVVSKRGEEKAQRGNDTHRQGGQTVGNQKMVR